MKKRIFAASMASVMALSSVSVVAFADETKADFGEAVTKAELKEYVASFESFIEKELDDYGTKQSQNFLDAYDYAKAVSGDANADDVAVNAAYQMLKSVRASMSLYTIEQLKELVEDCKADYDSENKRDENVKIFGEVDNIYDTKKFATFETAYGDAESCVEYGTGGDATNLYVELKDAHDALVPLKTVTKSQFRAAMKDYEALISDLEKYEDWRRGEFTVNATTGGAKDANDKKLDITKANVVVDFAALKNVVTGTSDVTLLVDDDGNDKRQKNTYVKIDSKNTGATTVEGYITAASEEFEGVQKSNVTSNTSVYNAYKAAVEAVKVFKGWKVDKLNFARKQNLSSLMKQYNDELVATYPLADGTTDFATSIIGSDSYLEVKDGKLLVTATGATQAGITALKALKIENGKFAVDSGAYNSSSSSTDTLGGSIKDDADYKEGLDLTAYVPITSDMVASTDTSPTADQIKDNNVKAALIMIETYLAEAAKDKNQDWPTAWAAATKAADDAKDGFGTLDENDIVATAKGDSTEFSLIYRWASYAFVDKMPSEEEPENYKKADLKALIEKCYVLADDIGDFSFFEVEYNELVEARKGAIEYQREADAYAKKLGKDYKDGKTSTTFDLSYDIGNGRDNSIAKSTSTSASVNTTAVYKALNEVYDATSKEFAKYPVSYGEIAELIAATSEGLENKAYGASADAIAAAVADLSVKLSTLGAEEGDVAEGNEAFNEDHDAFNKYNRLFVDDDKSTDPEKALYASYNALKNAIEDATKAEDPDVVLGDADGDGVLTPKDAAQILKAYAQLVTLTDAQKKAADFNKDGNVDAKDALAILKSLAGIKE